MAANRDTQREQSFGWMWLDCLRSSIVLAISSLGLAIFGSIAFFSLLQCPSRIPLMFDWPDQLSEFRNRRLSRQCPHFIRKKNMVLQKLLLIVFLGGLSLVTEDRVLFKFDDPDAAKAWQTVNDGVMGGRSDGRFKINEDKKLEFFGTLSLENNGGFASLRSREAKLGLENGDSIVIRVRGDGRDYNFNLNVPRSIGRNSYRQSFKTKKDEWIQVTLPLDKFVATWRGSDFPNEKLVPGNIKGMGIQLSDKKAGPFILEVEWIKASQLPANTSDPDSH